MIIIETDLIPFQYFNRKFKRVLKVIPFGNHSFNVIKNESNYFRVVKSLVNSINITISVIKNPIYLQNLLSDNLHITLNLKKNELE